MRFVNYTRAININLKEITEIVWVLIKRLEFDERIRIFVFFSEKNRKIIRGILFNQLNQQIHFSYK